MVLQPRRHPRRPRRAQQSRPQQHLPSPGLQDRQSRHQGALRRQRRHPRQGLRTQLRRRRQPIQGHLHAQPAAAARRGARRRVQELDPEECGQHLEEQQERGAGECAERGVVGPVGQPGECDDAFECDGCACCCYFFVIPRLGGFVWNNDCFLVTLAIRRVFRRRGWDRCSISF